jgi:septal ring factor EnvC (AmiA/AmiB activator)
LPDCILPGPGQQTSGFEGAIQKKDREREKEREERERERKKEREEEEEDEEQQKPERNTKRCTLNMGGSMGKMSL